METTARENAKADGAEAAEIERLKEEARREHEMYLRALADFDNYRRRIERERGAAARDGKRDLLISLLEVLDSFDRALEHMDGLPQSLAEGVQAIHRKLLSQLEAQGVIPFNSLGQEFDPQLHEAIASDQSDEHAPGTVIEEIQRGYRWGDEVLRPARVRVAQSA